eukprot:COSAG01_NODE_4712_length_4798_cov_3.005959_5_plen_62_part_00
MLCVPALAVVNHSDLFSASQTDNVSQEFERAFQTWDKQMTRMMMTKPLSGTLCARLLFFSS